MNKIQLVPFGVKAKDKVTGFEGIVTGRIQWMYGCDQYCITPPVDKDGKLGDGKWFDEGRVQVIGEGIREQDVKVEQPGFDLNVELPTH